MDWIDYIVLVLKAFFAGMVVQWVIGKAFARADEGRGRGVCDFCGWASAIETRSRKTLTLLRRHTERQEQAMTLIQQIKDTLATVLSKESAIEAKEDALINFAKAAQAKVKQLEGLLADAVAKLQGGDNGSIVEDLTGIQGQLSLLNASLDTDAAKLDGAIADPAPVPPADTTTPPPAEMPGAGVAMGAAPVEETVDTTPAVETVPTVEEQVDQQIAESPNPAGDAPVTEAPAEPATDAPVAPTEG
jgi:hypothetical protein